MDFFGIGPGEVLLILIVVLIIWGPERLVEVGKTLGKTVHVFRKAAADLTTQVTREIEETKAAVLPQDGAKAAPPHEIKAAATARSEANATPPQGEGGDQR